MMYICLLLTGRLFTVGNNTLAICSNNIPDAVVVLAAVVVAVAVLWKLFDVHLLKFSGHW